MSYEYDDRFDDPTDRYPEDIDDLAPPEGWEESHPDVGTAGLCWGCHVAQATHWTRGFHLCLRCSQIEARGPSLLTHCEVCHGTGFEGGQICRGGCTGTGRRHLNWSCTSNPHVPRVITLRNGWKQLVCVRHGWAYKPAPELPEAIWPCPWCETEQDKGSEAGRDRFAELVRQGWILP